ncbi:MAG: hypothetical protein LPK09_14565 [Hymenobacteraceae bacterium]|nr:hypothetical protein [Hymenobacteraceae bacterium]
MANAKLYNGEQFLIQTLDKKLSLTTHRLIQKRIPWMLHSSKSVMLEDITGWEIKVTDRPLYLGMSLVAALMVYFNDSFLLLSGFFMALYLMTRQQRIHIMSPSAVMVIPLEVEETCVQSLIDMVRVAQQNRLELLKSREMAYS